MNEINNDDIKSILYEISKNFILPKHRNLKDEDIKLKNNKDFVTSVDIRVENELRKALQKFLPNSLFVGEESFSNNPNILKNYNQESFCWTVDPIDGTKNFIKGEINFAVMVALTFKEKILQSWIYKPFTGEFSFAQLNDGTYINNEKILITKNTNIKDSIGSISSKYWENINYNKIKNIRNRFKAVNSLGCIGFEYVDIVKSVRHFAILSKLYPWDHIPGILLVKEAGGHIMHFNETTYNHTKKSNNLVVTNSIKLLNEILNLIKE